MPAEDIDELRARLDDLAAIGAIEYRELGDGKLKIRMLGPPLGSDDVKRRAEDLYDRRGAA
jgi:hypothetical protein